MKKIFGNLYNYVLPLSFVLAAPGLIFAQVQAGRIVGTVYDHNTPPFPAPPSP